MGNPYPPSTKRSAKTKHRIRSSTCPASDRSPEPTTPTSPIYPNGHAEALSHNGDDSAISRPPHHWETDGERKVFLHDYDVHIPALLKDGWTQCFSPKTLSYLKFLEEEDIQTEVEAEEEELFCTCFGVDDGSKMVECANAENGCLMRWFHVGCLSSEAQKRGLAREGKLPRASLHITEDGQRLKRSGRTMTDE
ncbi:MAG: hypothetical protein M1835_003598 [Candelina submexicana]|nr:MAG: hypothetical protein M1835_003598 [Candelina submexicana]